MPAGWRQPGLVRVCAHGCLCLCACTPVCVCVRACVHGCLFPSSSFHLKLSSLKLWSSHRVTQSSPENFKSHQRPEPPGSSWKGLIQAVESRHPHSFQPEVSLSACVSSRGRALGPGKSHGTSVGCGSGCGKAREGSGLPPPPGDASLWHRGSEELIVFQKQGKAGQSWDSFSREWKLVFCEGNLHVQGKSASVRVAPSPGEEGDSQSLETLSHLSPPTPPPSA